MSPRKRRRLDLEALDDSFPDILGELDLEICLRERLARTLESRIAWALILQESLDSESTGATTSFKDVAIETLSVIEASSEFLFEREANHPTQAVPQQTPRPSRPPPKPKPPTRNPHTTFLYIKSADLEPPHDENHIRTYLLKCPTCSRTTFTSVQGLLNHARISHSQEWGSHDECVRACAVSDPGMDISAGIEVGLGPVGILPGLRSLFQRAVGAHSVNELLSDANSPAELPGSQPSQELTSGSHLTRTLGLHEDTPALAPFLGKQATRRGIKEWDSYGVVDIDGFEDDTTDDKEGVSIKSHKFKRWRMPYMHRNDVGPVTADSGPVVLGDNSTIVCGEQTISKDVHSALEEKFSIVTNIEETRTSKLEPADVAQASGHSLATPGTRFHFVARIVITDRSLWIPLDRRRKASMDHTHMWMISVDSPSYSHHITTILQKMTVTSVADPNAFLAMATSVPPFVVVGTTSEPFLAKVELCFSGAPDANGQMTSQTMVLEHWVELDMVKFTAPAVGEEQVVDIELDKATILMPIQTDYTPVDAKGLWNLDAGQVELTGSTDGDKAKDGPPTEDYAKILTSLLGKFPMTLKDTPRGRPPNPPLPYKLVSTPAQLKNLVLGRRKAIEWGRARALRDAYMQAIRDPQMAKEDTIPLTTADVFIWLSEEGHFLKRPAIPPKPSKVLTDKPPEVKAVESWCPVCGQGVDAHLMVDAVKRETADAGMKEHTKIEDEGMRSGDIQDRSFPYMCNIVPAELRRAQMPIMDVQALLSPRLYRPHISGMAAPKMDDRPTDAQAFGRFRAAHLVAACDPHICLAIERVTTRLKLPAFTSPPVVSMAQFPLDLMGTDKVAVETRLAPYAMLGLATQQFVRVLIEGGLAVAKGQKAIAAGHAASKRRRRAGKEKDTGVSMLTPAHVMNGIWHGRSQTYSAIDAAIFGCLGRLMVPADRGERLVEGIGKHEAESSQEDAVKTEQA